MALNFMTRQLAAEWAPKVRVNAIACGGVETDALAVVLTNDAIRKRLEEGTPMKRIGRVEDVAACALYLASPASAWVTGKILEVDGGTEAPAFTVPTPPL
jgi:7-alpha-hydroxysteroid dehydrogenase